MCDNHCPRQVELVSGTRYHLEFPIGRKKGTMPRQQRVENSLSLRYEKKLLHLAKTATVLIIDSYSISGIPCFGYGCDYSGYDVASSTEASLGDCQARCQKQSSCYFFVLTTSGTCWMKYTTAGMRSSTVQCGKGLCEGCSLQF